MKSIAAIYKPKDSLYKNVSTLIKADLQGKLTESYETLNQVSLASVSNTNLQLRSPRTDNTFIWAFRGTESLTTTNANLALGTDNFTIEFWLHRSSSAQNGIFTIGTNEDVGTFIITFGVGPGWTGATVDKLTLDAAWTGNCTSNTSFSTNVWYHIAYVRTSINSMSLYVNGSLDRTFAINSSFNFTKTTAILGKATYVGTNSFDGYIADFRIVKGQAIYTAPFSVPTASLTPTENGRAVPSQLPVPSNVVLMCLNGPLLTRDTSVYNQTITSTTPPALVEFSASRLPLGGLYATYLHNRSTISLANADSSINLASSNFTIEMWFYKTTQGGVEGATLANFYTNVSPLGAGTHIWITNENKIMVDDGVTAQTAFATVISNYTWYHLAVVRSSTTTTVYLNGTSIGSNTYTPITNNLLLIGAYANSSMSFFFGGYISNFRVVSQAIYTANFSVPTLLVSNTSNGGATPSTAPTPANVRLLTLQDPNFVDRSTTTKTLSTSTTTRPSSVYLGAEYSQISRKAVSDQNDLFSIEALPLSSITFGTTVSSYFIPDRIVTAPGALFTLIKSSDNKIFLTGHNDLGQVGDGTFVNKDQFIEITALNNARMASTGDAHTMVVKNDNTVWATGRGEFGSLGTGLTTNRNTPTQVLTNTISAICGDNHTIFLRTDGTVWGCGWNVTTQLGTTTNNVTGPFGDQIITITQIPGMSNVRSAGAGTYFTILVKNDNTAWASGNNGSGQFGKSNTTSYSSFTQIHSNIKSVQCTEESSFFIKTDNTLWVCGENNYRQLGLGYVTGNVTTLTQLTAFSTSIKSVAPGYRHTIFVKDDHTAWAVGLNSSFQLGTGTTTLCTIPALIATNVDYAACGINYTILKKLDGSILAVGDNSYGQLGLRNNFFSANSLTDTTSSFFISNTLTYIPPYAGFFDAGSYITVPTHSGFNLPGDFTIECWWKTPTVLPTTGHQAIWVLGSNGAASNGLLLYAPTTANTLRFFSNNAILGAATTITTNANTWYHLAAVRSGTTLRLYINGVVAITILNNTTSFATHASNGISIGTTFDGTTFTPSNQPQYVSGLRVVRGVAVYSELKFSPPTSLLTATSNGNATPSVLPALNNISLLALQNSSVYQDNSSQPKVINRVGDVTMSQYQTPSVVGKIVSSHLSPWSNNDGYWSTYFNGSSYLSVADDDSLSFESSPFTIEFWWYPASTTTHYDIMGKWANVAASNEWILQYRHNDVSAGKGFRFAINNDTSRAEFVYTGLIANTWSHVALSKDSSNNYRLFINGSQVGSTVNNANAITNTSQELRIGQSTVNPFTGYISNLRIVKRQALYTNAFSPTTTPISTLTNGNAASASSVPTLSTVSLLALQKYNYVDSSAYAWRESMFAGSFNGANYLSSSSSVSFDTDQFTIECWINPSTVQTGFVDNNDIVSDFRHQYGPNNGWRLSYYSGVNSSIGFSSETAGGSSEYFAGPNTISRNIWTHIAITRDASNIARIFYNGVLVASKTFTKNINGSASGLRVGASEIDDLRFFFSGSISNLRIVKGQALYTQTFTPPLYNLTTSSNGTATPSEIPTPSNVLLLMLQSSNILTDNSPTPKTFTAVGTAPTSSSTLYSRSLVPSGTLKAQSFNPFSSFRMQKTKYSSSWFDAASYLTVQPSTNFNLSGDFTIEFWVNTTVFSLETAASRRIIALGSSTSTALNLLQLLLFTTAASNIISIYTTSIILQGSIAVADGGWHHVAISRSSNNLRLFVDGVQSGPTVVTSQAFNAGASSEIHIGKDSTSVAGRYNGYLANLRIINGTGVYTGGFFPPIAPVESSGASSAASYRTLTNVNTSFNSSQCGLLLNFNDDGVFDSSGNSSIATYFEARSSHSKSKWKNKQGLYLDGTNYITSTPTIDTNFGTRDFTVEAWIWPTISTAYTIIDSRTSSSTNWILANENSGTRRLFWYYGTNASGTYVAATTATTICLSAWNHVMYTRSNNVGNLYCNGIRVATGADTNNYSTIPTLIYNGVTNNLSNYFNGYLDDIRITNGSARATGATYTVPTRHAPTR